jgi:adenylate cyclase, class 2
VDELPSRNFELKVRCTSLDLVQIRGLAVASGFRDFTILHHRDTYFHTHEGRLKLRQIETEAGESSAELIGYRRHDRPGARWSHFYRSEIAPDQVARLRQALALTVGERVVVRKRREVAFRGSMRLHLDEVEGLGSFIELERVTMPGDEAAAEAESTDMIGLLGLERLPSEPGSYAELLLATLPA